MKTGRYNLKELLTHNEIEQIIIPEIQRDYVWQKANVEKLLTSIYDAYKSKKVNQITISNNNEPISNHIIGHLQQEYDRLKFNHKIGFIYAYHDHEFAGKFFLIDGQQRITTLYLLLLILYKKSNLKKDFQELYFQDGKLKVDYRVREASHDFLTDFIIHILSESSIDFTKTKKYYKNEYQYDETIKNILANYRVIDEFIKNKITTKNNDDENKKELDNFLKYIENFIELNYFDTHLSEQGEQLYIYMNSRGENLSYQEIIKSEIINKISAGDDTQKAEHKKKAGKNWEDWQNFFWQKEHRKKNENADIGFQEFLKWAAIIEICTKDEPEIQKLKVLVKGKEHEQTITEARENYIHRIEKRINEQNILLEEYQKKSKSFSADFIKSIFDALVFVVEKNDKYIPFDKKWLANDLKTIDYVFICPLLYFIANNQWQSEHQKNNDIRRLAMFLKNLTYFEADISRNPDRATILAIDMVKQMVITKQTDITSFLDASFDKKYKSLLTEFERYKLQLCNAVNSPRNDLELFIWDTILDDGISSFCEGNVSILFQCLSGKTKLNELPLNYNFTDISSLEKFRNTFKKVVVENRTSDILRRVLLTYGEYFFKDGSYSSHLGGLHRYTFIDTNPPNPRDKFREWNDFFNKDNVEKQRKALLSLLIEFNNLYKADANLDIASIFDMKIVSYNQQDWLLPFIKYEQVLNYCINKRVYYENPQRIILISKLMASSSYIEIQTFLLHLLIANSWLYTDENPGLCVYDFKLENNNIIENKEQKNAYALNISWDKSGEWKIELLHRDKNTPLVFLNKFAGEAKWEQTEDRFTFDSRSFHTVKPHKSIMENVNDAKTAYDHLKKIIETVLNK